MVKDVVNVAVNKYSYRNNGNVSLSAHFKVREFASKSGGVIYTDNVLIDTNLIDMLEKLYSKLECTSITVNSGYRCAVHDKAVGGNGSGQHTKGTAADIVCKNKDGIINAKIVCCVAADLGFGGVANISTKYQAVHVDARTSSQYRGDEIRGTNSIWKYNSSWTDFYKYWGLSKSDVYGNTSEKTYFSKCTYSGTSIALALASIGIDCSYTYRTKIAVANGVKNYTGTSTQNTNMLNLLKQGKLIRP